MTAPTLNGVRPLATAAPRPASPMGPAAIVGRRKAYEARRRVHAVEGRGCAHGRCRWSPRNEIEAAEPSRARVTAGRLALAQRMRAFGAVAVQIAWAYSAKTGERRGVGATRSIAAWQGIAAGARLDAVVGAAIRRRSPGRAPARGRSESRAVVLAGGVSARPAPPMPEGRPLRPSSRTLTGVPSFIRRAAKRPRRTARERRDDPTTASRPRAAVAEGDRDPRKKTSSPARRTK